jgi:chemotaxis signal transduction protein
VSITIESGTPAGTNGSAPAPALPAAGFQAGDWILAVFASREATDGTVSLPAGWDQRVNDRGTGGLVGAWTRPWQSGDVTPTYTLGGHTTGSSGDSAIGVILRIRPTAGSTLSFVDASTPSHNGASSTTVGPIDGDSLTVAANGIVLVVGQHRETSSSFNDLTGDGLTWAQNTYISNASGADNSLCINSALSNNVAVTDKSFTVGGSGGSSTGAGFMLFFNEVASIDASLSSTEGADSLQASASVAAVSEILRISWAQLEIPEAPEVTSTASLSATELDDTLVGAIAVNIAASLSSIEDQDTLSASASSGSAAEILRISWAQLEIPESSSATLSLTATEASDTLSSSASVAAAAEILRISWAQLEIPEASGGAITASAAITERGDTLSASLGGNSLSAEAFSISISFAPAIRDFEIDANPFSVTVDFESAARAFALTAAPFSVLASFGDVTLTEGAGAGGTTASLSATEQNDSLIAAASLAVSASASLTEDADVLAGVAAVGVVAQASLTEDADTLVAAVNATGSLSLSLTAVEADDSVVAVGALAVTVTASLLEDVDSLASAVSVAAGPITASLSTAEDGDSLGAVAAVAISASLTATESADTLSGQLGTPQIAADFSATESDDTVTASAALGIVASVSITEADDLSSASASVFIVATASITEEDDDFTGGWGRQSFPAHIGLTNRGRGPRGSSAGGGPLGSSRSKGSITTTEWP